MLYGMCINGFEAWKFQNACRCHGNRKNTQFNTKVNYLTTISFQTQYANSFFYLLINIFFFLCLLVYCSTLQGNITKKPYYRHDRIKNWALIISCYVLTLFFIHTTSTCIVRLGDICNALRYSNQYFFLLFCTNDKLIEQLVVPFNTS